jgi:Putative MetA-pathway of phenol degradation
MKIKRVSVSLLWLIVGMIFLPINISAQEIPYYLYDRGTGIPMSIAGTYVRNGELLIYPFYEYYYDSNIEYEPHDFGFPSINEYRGKYTANEGLIFLGYGISDRLAVEFEGGIISATLTKSENDTSALQPEFTESGLSDIEGQVRWRWNHESEGTPEFFNYFEFVFPTGEKNSLIGTSDWEFKLGGGVIKGFRIGTFTLRLTVDYSTGEKNLEPGEISLEYLKRISDDFRIFMMIEGSQDEFSFVPEVQWFITPGIMLNANTGFGITSKATDIATEVGIMFSLFP